MVRLFSGRFDARLARLEFSEDRFADLGLEYFLPRLVLVLDSPNCGYEHRMWVVYHASAAFYSARRPMVFRVFSHYAFGCWAF
jgi:hypothetical protein